MCQSCAIFFRDVNDISLNSHLFGVKIKRNLKKLVKIKRLKIQTLLKLSLI